MFDAARREISGEIYKKKRKLEIVQTAPRDASNEIFLGTFRVKNETLY